MALEETNRMGETPRSSFQLEEVLRLILITKGKELSSNVKETRQDV